MPEAVPEKLLFLWWLFYKKYPFRALSTDLPFYVEETRGPKCGRKALFQTLGSDLPGESSLCPQGSHELGPNRHRRSSFSVNAGSSRTGQGPFLPLVIQRRELRPREEGLLAALGHMVRREGVPGSCCAHRPPAFPSSRCSG